MKDSEDNMNSYQMPVKMKTMYALSGIQLNVM